MFNIIIRNPAMGYILSRYITYAIQFINSIFIAIYLGPIYLGIWGFIMLVLQYLNQINFGVPQSVQTIASISKHKEKYISTVVGNAVVILSCISVILGITFLFNYFFDWDFGKKYNFSMYSLYIYIIAILTYFNSLLSNILRVYGRIWEMAFSQSLLPLATLTVLILCNKEQMVMALVWAYMITNFISLIVFIIRVPIKIRINFNTRIWKTIQKKGWYLFIYNASFYFILISTRSFVSYYFEVKEFGYFTFAFSLANILVLLLDSFTFLIWPKLLNRLARLNNIESYRLLNNVRNLYLTSTHLMLHLGVFTFPYFLLIFPKFTGTYTVFSLIALTIVMFTNSFGYQGLIIARGKEKIIGNVSLLTLLLNIFLCYILIKYVHVNYEFVILGTLISYFIYIILLNIVGRQILKLDISTSSILKDAFPANLFFPFAASLLLVLLKLDFYYYFIPFGLFLILNFRTLKEIKNKFKKLVDNPKFFEI